MKRYIIKMLRSDWLFYGSLIALIAIIVSLVYLIKWIKDYKLAKKNANKHVIEINSMLAEQGKTFADLDEFLLISFFKAAERGSLSTYHPKHNPHIGFIDTLIYEYKNRLLPRSDTYEDYIVELMYRHHYPESKRDKFMANYCKDYIDAYINIRYKRAKHFRHAITFVIWLVGLGVLDILWHTHLHNKTLDGLLDIVLYVVVSFYILALIPIYDWVCGRLGYPHVVIENIRKELKNDSDP